MKILTLTDVLFPDTIGGAGKVAFHLGLELGSKGHEVHFISRNPGGKLPVQQALTSNIYIHRFYTPEKESLSLFVWEIINSFSLCRKVIGKHNFDLMCIHQSMTAMGPLLIKKLSNTPTIYYYHSPWHEEFLIKKDSKPLWKQKIFHLIGNVMCSVEKKILFKSSKVISLSKYMRDKLIGLHEFPEEKVKIISGGIDLNEFSPPDPEKDNIVEAEGIPSDKIIFLTIRNLVRRMGLENLIEAFNQSDLLKEKGVLLIGGKGPLQNQLKSLVSKYGLQDTVRFTGYITEEDLPKYYQAADYFVLPTEKLEGFGLVILESMACGTPVIGTPAGAIPELIGKFDKKLLTMGVSSSDIREKLEEVVKNQDEYSFDSQKCRKFVEDNYSWRNVADEFEKVAYELVKK